MRNPHEEMVENYLAAAGQHAGEEAASMYVQAAIAHALLAVAYAISEAAEEA